MNADKRSNSKNQFSNPKFIKFLLWDYLYHLHNFESNNAY